MTQSPDTLMYQPGLNELIPILLTTLQYFNGFLYFHLLLQVVCTDPLAVSYYFMSTTPGLYMGGEGDYRILEEDISREISAPVITRLGERVYYKFNFEQDLQGWITITVVKHDLLVHKFVLLIS